MKIVGHIVLLLVATLAVASVLGVVLWWTVYKYKDCIAVGHSNTYCTVKVFTN